MKTTIAAVVAALVLALAGCGGPEAAGRSEQSATTPDFSVTPAGLECPNADRVSDQSVTLPGVAPTTVRSCAWDCATYSVWTRVRLTVLAADGATDPVLSVGDGC